MTGKWKCDEFKIKSSWEHVQSEVEGAGGDTSLLYHFLTFNGHRIGYPLAHSATLDNFVF